MREEILDVMAERYPSTPMVAIWSQRNKVIMERRFWIAVLRHQKDLGLSISNNAISAYEEVVERVDLDSIAKRETVTRQDVKARIEEFNALAGYELIHEGFTSRDLTDNIEQMQIYNSLLLVRDHAVALLSRLGEKASEYATLDICGRSHNVPGQTTILGKRVANSAQEMLIAFDLLEYVIQSYPLRGIKGAMGTQQDMADLLENKSLALKLEMQVMRTLSPLVVLDSVGQVYPRSLDFMVLSVLLQLASGPANFAKSIRLMAGHELVHEGFKEGQTASTAMPHKINSRTCERVSGFVQVLAGYLRMTEGLLGDQWNEGDVSCSVPRRVALSSAFFAIDGLMESIMTVLDEMQVFPGMIKAELEHYLPFLSTTRILMAMVKKGVGRETAHTLIKRHAIAAVDAIRKGEPNSFERRLLEDPEFPLNAEELWAITKDANHGLAPRHVEMICMKITELEKRYPEAAKYNPEPIL
ncbi:MAG: adenylosuccinate lyase [bacterium]|nr:adenylosuccinate lyase [bacterium]